MEYLTAKTKLLIGFSGISYGISMHVTMTTITMIRSTETSEHYIVAGSILTTINVLMTYCNLKFDEVYYVCKIYI